MVYISSHNIISSLGFSTNQNIENFRNSVSGVLFHNDKKYSKEDVFFSLINHDELNKKFEEISDNKDYTLYEKLLILSVSDALRNSKINPSPKDTLILISTTKGNIDLLNNENPENPKLKLYDTAKVLKDFFKTENLPQVISNACISGTLALAVAKRFIDSGLYKNIIVTGADIISEFTLSGFLSFKAIGTSVCKPFDKNRDGINLGEGAGTIILTSEKQFAAEPHIFLSGASCTNDANHISGPSRTGNELALAISNSLIEANIDSSKVQYISAHGTATSYNDEMEAKAFSTAGILDANITSVKAYIGHTLGAAGIIETVLGISAIENQEIYPTIGFEEIGVPAKINVNNIFRKTKIENVVKTASGFGGCNAALVLSSNVPEHKKQIENINLDITESVVIKEDFYINSNKKTVINSDAFSFGKFTKAIYTQQNMNYPKFYKMDNLSKLAFIASELLLKNKNIIEKYKPEEISIIISNRSSSLNTDFKYQESISDRENYFPSPSVFVYTLANVMIGEVCIRHNIKGENTVFIHENFDVDFLKNYIEILFKTNKTKLAITGRIEYDFPSEKHEAVLYLIENKENATLNFNKININKIYNT
jgi:3-oxoacyl-(acyl-carrier-protein) synthase